MGDLAAVLTRARELGFLGPGPVERHIAHAEGFASVVGAAPGWSMDLGSGAGVPGLVLASMFPESRWVLVDASRRRAAFAGEAVRTLGLAPRTEVVVGRAEELGRDERLRGRFELVVARAFGAPAVVAECAAPFLDVGGRLVVSEPPEGRDRWPNEGLSVLAMSPEPARGPYRLIRQERRCPARFPRRAGVPARRPLF